MRKEKAMRVAKPLAVVAAAFALTATMWACKGETEVVDPEPTPDPDPEPAVIGTHTITDGVGREVEITDNVTSIVSPFGALSQVLLGLGQGDLLTGGEIVSSYINDIIFADEQAAIVKIPQKDINPETVLSVNPDFIIVNSADLVATFEQYNVPVIQYVLNDLDALIFNAHMLADAIGADDAKAVADEYDKFYTDLIAKVSGLTANIPEDEKPVVYFVSKTDGLSTYGDKFVIDDWVSICGGHYCSDLLGISDQNAVNITSEQLLALDPDIIICRQRGAYDLFMTDPTYANLKAVQNETVYVNPMGAAYWSNAHFEAPLQLAWACKIFAPDYTESIDTRAIVDEFFEKFYGYTLSDVEYEVIMTQLTPEELAAAA